MVIVKQGVLFDREAVVDAHDGAKNLSEILVRLGIKPHADNFRRAREACVRFDLIPPERPKGRLIDRVSDEDFIEAAEKADTVGQLVRFLNIKVNTENFMAANSRLELLGRAALPVRVQNSRWSQESLEELIESLPEEKRNSNNILKAMNLTSTAKNYRKLEKLLGDYGIPYLTRKPLAKTKTENWRTDPDVRARIMKLGPQFPSAWKLSSHLRLGYSEAIVTRFIKQVMDEEGLVIGSEYVDPALVPGRRDSRSKIKKAFSSLPGVNPELCSECGLESVWNGKPIVMHLDHIDGDTSHNDPSNLRFLCPNCHSQTETYCRLKFTS